MESFYKQTTVACAMSPESFPTILDSFETAFNLHYQIVLRVADEANQIEEKWRVPLYKFLAGCVRTCGGSVEAIGGAPDYVHLLIRLPATKTIAELLRELKLLSQTWARRKMQIPHFGWQDGGEAFTVSAPPMRKRFKAGIFPRACNRAAIKQKGEKNADKMV